MITKSLVRNCSRLKRVTCNIYCVRLVIICYEIRVIIVVYLFISEFDPFYILTVGTEGYCCTWSHTHTHTHTQTHTHTLTHTQTLTHTHSDTHTHSHTHYVGLLWSRDRSDTVTFTWKHTTLSRGRIFVSPAGFEPPVPASDRLQTHALNRAATGLAYVCWPWEWLVAGQCIFMIYSFLFFSTLWINWLLFNSSQCTI